MLETLTFSSTCEESRFGHPHAKYAPLNKHSVSSPSSYQRGLPLTVCPGVRGVACRGEARGDARKRCEVWVGNSSETKQRFLVKKRQTRTEKEEKLEKPWTRKNWNEARKWSKQKSSAEESFPNEELKLSWNFEHKDRLYMMLQVHLASLQWSWKKAVQKPFLKWSWKKHRNNWSEANQGSTRRNFEVRQVSFLLPHPPSVCY